jgi:hypothetical protein
MKRQLLNQPLRTASPSTTISTDPCLVWSKNGVLTLFDFIKARVKVVVAWGSNSTISALAPAVMVAGGRPISRRGSAE